MPWNSLFFGGLAVCHNILSMPIRWHKMYWKELLTIKSSVISQLANCTSIFSHYLIELFHTSNIIPRLFVAVVIQIDCNVWLECMVIIKKGG